jgi:hypothetical protein
VTPPNVSTIRMLRVEKFVAAVRPIVDAAVTRLFPWADKARFSWRYDYNWAEEEIIYDLPGTPENGRLLPSTLTIEDDEDDEDEDHEVGVGAVS